MNSKPIGGMPCVTRKVLARDLAIFYVKLALDGLKGMILFQAAIIATGLDFLLGPSREGHRFYKVLRFAERFDLWLNLYEPAVEADASGSGLFESSDETSETFLGRVERLISEFRANGSQFAAADPRSTSAR